ncbi:unnamed protein product [Strongylus vulgaris]|uniref:Uncharacterized protein n=1 Tax=Strongylus vulgaris TaxID=40348 RepID=A0A3P7LML6_STRVU|nr:unnamed protein product [Strongylus vulgaris]
MIKLVRSRVCEGEEAVTKKRTSLKSEQRYGMHIFDRLRLHTTRRPTVETMPLYVKGEVCELCTETGERCEASLCVVEDEEEEED